MIRFACPGCGAVYTVEDTKGGKTGKCPKCQAQFVIPAAAPAASAPSAPPPVPAPPTPPAPAADPNAPVEIAPCPKCQARLSVATADLGADVECPYCKTVYTARRPGERGSARTPALSARDEDRPSRRRREDDDEEDRPRRRRDEDDEEDRPRRRPVRDGNDDDRPRRRRDEDEDDDRPRRRRRPRRMSNEVSTVARLNYVLGGLSLLCGCLFTGVGTIAGAAVRDAMARDPGAANKMPIDPGTVMTIVLVMGGFTLLLSVMLIAGGIGVSQRKNWGRILTIVTSGFGLVFGAVYLLGTVANLIALNIPGVCTGLVGTGIWGGYGVQALMTMIKFGDEFE